MLPGAIRTYLGTLDDAALDRIVEGQGWTTGLMVNHKGDRCLVGHASGCRTVCPSETFAAEAWYAAEEFDDMVGAQQVRAEGLAQVVREIKAFIAGMRGGVSENAEAEKLDVSPEGRGEAGGDRSVHEVCSAQPAYEAPVLEGAAL